MKNLITALSLVVIIGSINAAPRSKNNPMAQEIEKLSMSVKNSMNLIELTNLSIDAQSLKEKVKDTALQSKTQIIIDQANTKLEQLMNDFTKPQAVSTAQSTQATS